MIKRRFYKLLTIILVAVMLLTMAPTTASATTGYNMSDQTEDLIITGGGLYIIGGTSSKYRIIVNAPGQIVNISLEGVDIQLSTGCAFQVKAGTVNLKLTGPNNLKSGEGYAGLNNGENNLVITGDSYASLTAESGLGGAGIGGNKNCTGSNITIHGGTVKAIGWGGAGIGGGSGIIGQDGSGGNGTNMLIDGGTVIAQGREGAGIGGGLCGNGSNITIDGGNVTADTVAYNGQGAGIGGGQYGSGTNITIKKGTVIAKSAAGAGIGGGNGLKLFEAPAATTGENISIKGGTVTAQGGSDSAGIGASYGGTVTGIIIDGGSVKATPGTKMASVTGPFAIGSDSAAVTPKNSSGSEVFLTTRTAISDTEKGYLAGISYGMAGANAIDGTYYLYLPKYEITYNNTEGATHNNPSEYNILDCVTLSDAAKSDYEIEGWSDAATGGNQFTTISEGSTGHKVFYAVWSPIPMVESIQSPTAITDVAYGTAKTASALGLPSKVKLVTDQGSKDAEVTWNVDSCSYDLSVTTEQTFTVNGTVTLSNGILNKNNIPLATQISVTVKAKPTVDRVLQKIAIPAAITGVAHGAEKNASALGLPSTIQLETDQGNLNAGVTWAVDACSYDLSVATEQAFTVNGVVTLPGGVVNTLNLPLGVSIGVTVKGTASEVTTPSGINDNSSGGNHHNNHSSTNVATNSGSPNNSNNEALDKKTENFLDTQNHWAKGAITYVTEKGLFSGTENSHFSPDASMTRGMLVTVFGRLWSIDNGEVKVKNSTKFSDVKTSEFYSRYVEWSVENGIAGGVGNGQFAAKKSVTREQLAVMLYNYAKLIGIDVSNAKNVKNSYSDNNQISDWAKAAMEWTIGEGLMSGKTVATLDPQGTATRAEVAVIFQRFAEKKNLNLL